MPKQNIFDDEVFFSGYKELRENKFSANEVDEKPALFDMLGDVAGLKIFDMGCGFGENCKRFVKMGAKSVVGIDISEKMLSAAMSENADKKITYRRLCIEDISELDQKFDIVVSSLAVHYIKDFNKICKDVYGLLNDGGIFLFSQEHPLTTAPSAKKIWATDENGEITHYMLSDYSVGGERRIKWFIDDVEKYHRTFSDIVNALCGGGFIIREMREPIPSEDVMRAVPEYKKKLHKPNFLLIKAQKPIKV